MDGTGPSGILLNPADGHIYNIKFSWYGYGVIEYHVHSTSPDSGEQEEYTLHRTSVAGQTSIKSPHLPIRVDVGNGGTALSNIAYVTGRSYSLAGKSGKYTPIYRPSATFVANMSSTSQTVFQPVLSIRRKTNYLGIPIRITGADIVCSTPQWIMVKTGSALTGASWGTVPNQVNSETAIEQDTSSTAMTGGITIWISYVDKAVTKIIDLADDFNIQDVSPVTVCTMNATNQSGTVSVALRWTEEW